MTRQETISIMAILKTAYPNFYHGTSEGDATGVVSLWMDMFQDEPVALVAAAVKAFIDSDEKGYPPHIGAIKQKIRLITGGDKNTEMEAWNMVFRAISRGIYHSREDFEKFPEEIKSIVGSPEQIRQWAMMDSNTVQSVVASNFQRSYRAKMKRREEYNRLPEDVKKLVEAYSRKLMIKGN